MRIVLTTLLLSLLGIPTFAAPTCRSIVAKPGKSIELFSSDGMFRKDYPEIVDGLGPGSRIRLPDGSEHVLLEKMGAGALTNIYDLGDGWVIRIPQKWAPWRFQWKDYLTSDGVEYFYFGAIHSFVDLAASYQSNSPQTLGAMIR